MASYEPWAKEEVTCKMHKFETTIPISQAALMDGTLTEDKVKTELEHDLMNNVYYSIVFGKSSINMKGISTLSGRSKLSGTQASSLTTGTMLRQKVIEAKYKSEEQQEGIKTFYGFYRLLLPYQFSHLLLELYNEPQYVTIKDSLQRDLLTITKVFKGLDHPILYKFDHKVMFVPILSDVSFRKFSAPEGDYIRASILAGIVHFRPKEVVEITISAN
ncbi:hypothetical protein [Borrelia crocidurae]|nr:hypothetical protein [Borrelia crocidurae]